MTDGNKKLGYISIYRSIKDHWIWQDPIKFQWWISLLLEVNFKDKKVMLGNDLILCKRGQTVKSLKHFAELWNTTRDTARNFLVLLEKDGMILRKNLHKSTQITICNYDSYQDNLHANQTHSKQKPNASQTHSDTNNKGNKVNKENNDNKEFIPPSLIDVQKYCDDNGYTKRVANIAFETYSSNNWKDTKNNPIKNWKLKLQNVWFKPEHKKLVHNGKINMTQ